jgi:two-component system cell cycle sensor histidine kinase/response regulator CckA
MSDAGGSDSEARDSALLALQRAEEALRQKSELMRLLQAVAMAAHEAASADDAMRVSLSLVCAHTGWEVGHVYVPAPNRKDLLVPTGIWHVDDPRRFAAFQRVTEATPLAVGEGLPGRVLAERRPVWICDVEKDGNFPRLAAEPLLDVRAGFAFPVLACGDVAAVVEFFTTKPQPPDAGLLEVVGYIATQLERVIERDKAANALRLSEERYRLLVERSKVITWEVDLATWQFTYVSEYAESLLGYRRGAWYEPGFWTSHLHPEDREWAVKFCMECTARCEDHQFDYRMVSADGRTVWINDVVTVVAEGGRPVKLRGVMIDVTDRARLEEQLRQSQKMEAIGQLAGGVAHDFNNILSIIGGCSDVLLSLSGLGETERGWVQEIKSAGDRAAALTRQLLAFSRRQILKPVVLDLNQVIAGMEQMLRRLLREDIELSLLLAPGLALVKADAAQLEQVLLNLAVNARDAMPERGQLTIETMNIEADETFVHGRQGMRPGSYVLLAVSDTGCGMDEAVRAKVFEPFFTTKEPGKGTGLGLSTVYGIVKQSGGFINVYSEPGRGATFRIYLPAAPGKAGERGAARREPEIPRGNEVILLVEDDEGVRKLVSRILEAQGYTVLVAPNGEEALRVSDEHAGPIHLLLTDVIMPRLGGPLVAEQLAQRRPDLKVLYMSGYTHDATLRNGVLMSDVALLLLQKPFTRESLTRGVREALDQGQGK